MFVTCFEDYRNLVIFYVSEVRYREKPESTYYMIDDTQLLDLFGGNRFSSLRYFVLNLPIKLYTLVQLNVIE